MMAMTLRSLVGGGQLVKHQQHRVHYGCTQAASNNEEPSDDHGGKPGGAGKPQRS
jgi:hypothetical protein